MVWTPLAKIWFDGLVYSVISSLIYQLHLSEAVTVCGPWRLMSFNLVAPICHKETLSHNICRVYLRQIYTYLYMDLVQYYALLSFLDSHCLCPRLWMTMVCGKGKHIYCIFSLLSLFRYIEQQKELYAVSKARLPELRVEYEKLKKQRRQNRIWTSWLRYCFLWLELIKRSLTKA